MTKRVLETILGKLTFAKLVRLFIKHTPNRKNESATNFHTNISNVLDIYEELDKKNTSAEHMYRQAQEGSERLWERKNGIEGGEKKYDDHKKHERELYDKWDNILDELVTKRNTINHMLKEQYGEVWSNEFSDCWDGSFTSMGKQIYRLKQALQKALEEGIDSFTKEAFKEGRMDRNEWEIDVIMGMFIKTMYHSGRGARAINSNLSDAHDEKNKLQNKIHELEKTILQKDRELIARRGREYALHKETLSQEQMDVTKRLTNIIEGELMTNADLKQIIKDWITDWLNDEPEEMVPCGSGMASRMEEMVEGAEDSIIDYALDRFNDSFDVSDYDFTDTVYDCVENNFDIVENEEFQDFKSDIEEELETIKEKWGGKLESIVSKLKIVLDNKEVKDEQEE